MPKQISRKRLLSSERGLKAKKKGRFAMALCYPNTYEIAMSNLGFLTIYRMANELPHFRCERAFYWPQSGKTIESGREIGKFDVVGISLSYELDYPRAVMMIGDSGIPLLREERGESDPLVIAGGCAITLNPQPLTAFVDIFFIGEAEESFREFANLLAGVGRVRKAGWRKEMLRRASRIEGVYVPGVNDSAKRRWVSRLDALNTSSPLLTPNSHFSDMYLTEVGRGCPRGCRFCAASYAYRPFRIRSAASIIEHAGNDDLEFPRIGFVGAAVSDHPGIERLCMEFAKRGKEVGISSLRPDNLTPRLLSTLVETGMRTVTLAPEAGSEKMREMIGKPMTQDRILQSVQMCQEVGIRDLRLYFMIGLPFETDSDADAIVELATGISKTFRRRISVRLGVFVPKANTPFQWQPLAFSEVVERRVGVIKKGLSSRKNVRVFSRSTREVEVQAIFSRGGVDVGTALYNWYSGRNWKRAFRNAGVNRQRLLHDRLSTEAHLPWDFIDMSFPKSLLKRELMKAERAAS